MRTNEATLRRFLAPHSHADIANAAVDAILPFFAKAEAGRYDLGYGPKTNVGDVCSALWSGVGADAKGVIFAPACVSLEECPWDPARDLHTLLRQRYGKARDGIMRPDDIEAFERVFEEALGEALRGAISRTFQGHPGLRNGETVWQTVRYAVSTLLLFENAGHARAEDLRLLVALLSDTIPCGPRRDKPRIWYLLTGC